MLTQKGLAKAKEIRIELRDVLLSDEQNLKDPGLNDWRRHLNDLTASGMAFEGVAVGWKEDATPVRIEHVEDDDLTMVKGCMQEYLIARGFKAREG